MVDYYKLMVIIATQVGTRTETSPFPYPIHPPWTDWHMIFNWLTQCFGQLECSGRDVFFGLKSVLDSKKLPKRVFSEILTVFYAAILK